MAGVGSLRGEATPPESQLFLHLRNAAGEHNMSSASGTPAAPARYHVQCPPHVVYVIRRITLVYYADSMEPSLFGDAAELTNGILVTARNAEGDILCDFTDNVPIQRNLDWVLLAGTDVVHNSVPGGAPDGWFSRWTIARAGRALELDPGDSMGFDIRDNLGPQGLSNFSAQVHGRIIVREGA